MKQGTNIRKRRITYYDIFGRRSADGKRIKKRFTKIQLLKTILFVIVALTFLLLLCLIYPSFTEEFASKFYRKGSQSNDRWNKYSSAALSSKPKDNYKFTEQHEKVLERFLRFVNVKKQRTNFHQKEKITADVASSKSGIRSSGSITLRPDSEITTADATMPPEESTGVDETTPPDDVTTMEMATTEETTETNPPTTPPTTPPITSPTTLPPSRVITATCPDNTPLLAAIAVLAALLIALITGLLIFCCCPCNCCLAMYGWCNRRSGRYEVANAATAMSMVSMETQLSEGSASKEDLLRDAMDVGKISVLEFALQEARSSSHHVDEELITKAEKKLNQWKRTLNLLNGAYENKDMQSLLEYQQRFRDLDIQDEGGVYRRSQELQETLKNSLFKLENASQQKDEATILSTLGFIKSFGFPSSYISTLDEVQKANRVLNSIKNDRVLKGKSKKDMEIALKEAITQRNASSITKSIALIEDSGLSGLEMLVADGRRVAKELHDGHQKLRNDAWMKLQDASLQRNCDALREALRLCAMYGVEQEQIIEGEKLLKIVEREDQLLNQMKNLIEEKDSSKLLEAIAVFRTPGLMLVDKTGDVARADELLRELREKERLNRAKGDAMFRLQRAIDTGNVEQMDHMITALENLVSMGEEVNEAVLNRAKTKLETFRGRINYRVRMEQIKSAIERMAAAEKLAQLADLIEQMVELSADENYAVTADDSRVLDESRVLLHDLKRKHAIQDEIETSKRLLSLPQVPDSLEKITSGVKTMSRLKELAAEFSGVFGAEEEELLSAATLSANELQEKIRIRNSVQERLGEAIESRDHETLLQVLSEARNVEFMDEREIKNAKDKCDFLNPKKRVSALKQAMRSRDVTKLAESIEHFKDARVPNELIFLETAQRRLKKLRKLEKKMKKEEKRRKKAEAKREAEINALTQDLEMAIAARDIDMLQDALQKCENSDYTDKEIPLFAEAEELLDALTIARLRQNLIDAINRRDIFVLEKTINDADYGGFVGELGDDYRSAKDLLYHLRELHRLREAISGMNRSLISEICRYPKPPTAVLKVMTAVLVMLGEAKKNLSDWAFIQNMTRTMGDRSITRRVRRCAPGDVTPEVRDELKRMLDGLDVDTVTEISKGAGAFFAWMQCMLKESYYATNK